MVEGKKKISKIINLGSSSEGNAFYLEINRNGYEKPFGLLLDCGFTYNTISKKLYEYGLNSNNIDAVLITHRHLDHSRALKDFIKHGKHVFAPITTYDYHKVENVEERFIIRKLTIKGVADNVRVIPVPLDHNEPDGELVENYAYVVEIDQEFTIIYLTDTSHVRYNFSKYKADLIICEANHEKYILEHAIENAKGYHKTHLKRVLKSHMSVQRTALWLSNMNLSKTKLIILMHITANSKNQNLQKYKEIIKTKLIKSGKKNIPIIKVAKTYGGLE